MSRSLVTSEAGLEQYITRHPGRQFEWAVTSDTPGPIPNTSWNNYVDGDYIRRLDDGGAFVMPRGVKLVFRPVGTKGAAGIHCIFSDDGSTSLGQVIYEGPDDEELSKRANQLRDRKQNLDNEEDEFRAHQRKVNMEHMKVQGEIDKNRAALDAERSKLEQSKSALNQERESIEKSIKDSIALMKDVDDVFGQIDELRTARQMEIDSLITRAQKAEQHNTTAATIQHVADRLQLLVSIWKVKSISKDGDGIPTDVQKEIEEGLMLRSLKRYYSNVGQGAIQELANSLAMCPEMDKLNIFKGVFMTMDDGTKGAFLMWLREMAEAHVNGGQQEDAAE